MTINDFLISHGWTKSQCNVYCGCFSGRDEAIIIYENQKQVDSSIYTKNGKTISYISIKLETGGNNIWIYGDGTPEVTKLMEKYYRKLDAK